MNVRTANHLRAFLKAHELSSNGTKAILEERCQANGIYMDVPVASVPNQAAAPPPVHAPPVPDRTTFAPPIFQQAQPVAVAAVETRPAHNAPPTEPVSFDRARRLRRRSQSAARCWWMRRPPFAPLILPSMKR